MGRGSVTRSGLLGCAESGVPGRRAYSVLNTQRLAKSPFSILYTRLCTLYLQCQVLVSTVRCEVSHKLQVTIEPLTGHCRPTFGAPCTTPRAR